MEHEKALRYLDWHTEISVIRFHVALNPFAREIPPTRRPRLADPITRPFQWNRHCRSTGCLFYLARASSLDTFPEDFL